MGINENAKDSIVTTLVVVLGVLSSIVGAVYSANAQK